MPPKAKVNEPPPPQMRRRAPRRAAVAANPALIDDTPTSAAVRRDIAARWLAIGVTQDRAAREAGVDVRTVAKWAADEAFRARIADLRARAFTEIEADMLANVRFALDLERRVFTEEIKHDNPAYLEARPLLIRIRDLIFRIESPAPAGDDPARGVTVAVYNGAGGVQHEQPGRIVDSTVTGQ